MRSHTTLTTVIHTPVSHSTNHLTHPRRTHHWSFGWGQGGKASERATQPRTPRRGQGLATSGSLPPPPEQRMTPRVPTMRSQECEFTKSAKSTLARCNEQAAEQPPSKYGESRPLVRKACASRTHNKGSWRRTRWTASQRRAETKRKQEQRGEVPTRTTTHTLDTKMGPHLAVVSGG